MIDKIGKIGETRYPCHVWDIEDAEEAKKAAIRKQKQKERREAQKREREWRDAHTTWVKAWPKEQTETIRPPRRTDDDTDARGTR